MNLIFELYFSGRRIMFLAWCLILLVSCRKDSDQPFFEDREVLCSNDSVGAYAIPNIVVTPRGTILAFATARYGNSHDWGNVQKAVVIKSTDNGATWSPPNVIAHIPDWTVRQTSAIVDEESGKVFVFGHKSPRVNKRGEMISERWNISNPEEMKSLGAGHYVVVSEDEGESWSGMQSVALPYWPHDTGITLKYGRYKGRMILPARVTKGKKFHWPDMYNGVLISDDNGETWRAGGLTQSHVGEACVAELSDGRVYVNNRNHADNFGIRNHALSLDGGESFSSFGDDPELIEPTCDAGMIRYNDPGEGNLILFSNPATSAREHWDSGSRHHMTVRGSFDDGKTWPLKKLIFAGPAAYSGLAVGKEGMIFLIYERARPGGTNSRENLAIARFNLAWFEQKEVDPPAIHPESGTFRPTLEITLSGDKNNPIYYTTDGNEPNQYSKRYEQPFMIDRDAFIRAVAISADKSKSIETQARFFRSPLPAPQYVSAPDPGYMASGSFALIDGLRGSLNYNDGYWQGFEEGDLDVLLDLSSVRIINEIGVSCLQATDHWIFYPSLIRIEISEDGEKINESRIIKNNKPAEQPDNSQQVFSVRLQKCQGRYVRINVRNIKMCPDWHAGAGAKAWLFVDEISIK